MTARRWDELDLPMRAAYRRVRTAAIGIGLALCMAATFSVGHEMAIWKMRRIYTIEDAHAITPQDMVEVRRRAIVAMQRDTRISIERLRGLERDADDTVAKSAANALQSIRDAMK